MPSNRTTCTAPLIMSLAGLYCDLTLVVDLQAKKGKRGHVLSWMLSESYSSKRGVLALNRNIETTSADAEGSGESGDSRYLSIQTSTSPTYLVVFHILPTKILTLAKQVFFDWEFLAWCSTFFFPTLQKMRAPVYATKESLSGFQT